MAPKEQHESELKYRKQKHSCQIAETQRNSSQFYPRRIVSVIDLPILNRSRRRKWSFQLWKVFLQRITWIINVANFNFTVFSTPPTFVGSRHFHARLFIFCIHLSRQRWNKKGFVAWTLNTSFSFSFISSVKEGSCVFQHDSLISQTLGSSSCIKTHSSPSWAPEWGSGLDQCHVCYPRKYTRVFHKLLTSTVQITAHNNQVVGKNTSESTTTWTFKQMNPGCHQSERQILSSIESWSHLWHPLLRIWLSTQTTLVIDLGSNQQAYTWWCFASADTVFWRPQQRILKSPAGYCHLPDPSVWPVFWWPLQAQQDCGLHCHKISIMFFSMCTFTRWLNKKFSGQISSNGVRTSCRDGP